MAETVSKSETSGASLALRDLVDLLRPTQWIKNVVVFAGPAAGA